MTSKTKIYAAVEFFDVANGGRKSLELPPKYACIIEVGGLFFDCRLTIDKQQSITPYVEANAYLQLLSPDLAIPHLSPGVHFNLRELRNIGVGKVLEVL